MVIAPRDRAFSKFSSFSVDSLKVASSASHGHDQTRNVGNKYGKRAAVTVSYDQASVSDDSLAQDLCPQLSGSDISLSLTIANWSPSTKKHSLPSCVATSDIISMTIAGPMNFTRGFADLPPSLEIFYLNGLISLVPASPSTSDDGFDDVTGNLDWNEVWQRLPNVKSLNFFGTPLQGAQLPSTIPSRVIVFDVRSTGLVGTIPLTLFQNYAGTSRPLPKLIWRNNGLSGSIPSGLFTPFVGQSSSPSEIMLDWYNNKLDGSLPAGLFDPFTDRGTTRLYINLEGSKISGQLPDNLFPRGIVGAAGVLEFYAPGNALTGSIPRKFLSSMISNASITLYQLYLDLSSNLLNGSIPDDLLSTDANGAIGVNSFIAFSFRLNNNSLSGHVPPSLFLSRMASTCVATIELQQNQLSGSPPSICNSHLSSKLDLSSNKLNGTIPTSWNTCSIASINLASNPHLSGSLPPSLFNGSVLTSFNASYTSLTGDMPTTSTTLKTLGLSFCGLDFCSNTSLSAVSSLSVTSCTLDCTSALNCPTSYSPCSTTVCPPIAPVIVPSPPVAAPVSCPGTRPSPEFYCFNGYWTAPTIVTTPTLVVPPGAGVVVVKNITSSTIVLNGVGSSLNVSGCASNLTSIVVSLTESELKQLSKSSSKDLRRLLTIGGNGSNDTSCIDLDNIEISSIVRDGGCRKVSVSRSVVDGGSTLGAYFVVDSSSCNRWWIILVSVIGGVVVLLVLIAVVLVLFVPSVRHFVRPYSQPREPKGNL